jgi:hypothetical protein
MPLVRDEHKGTDRTEKPSSLPWVLAIVGFLVMLLVAFLLIGIFIIVPQATVTSTAPAAVQMNTTWLQSAQSTMGYGDYTNAAAALANVDETQPMELMDKHTFLGLAAESNTKGGKPKVGGKYYERYLSLGANIHQKSCAECHGPPASMPPVDLAAMTRSDRGKAYAGALAAAGTLKSRRDALVKELNQKPDEARLHILLFHLETALQNRAAAKKHANALSALDVKARSTPATSGAGA